MVRAESASPPGPIRSIGPIGPWGLSGRADPPGPSRPVCRSMRSNRSARPTWPDLSAYEVDPSPSDHAGARAVGRQAIGASADQGWVGAAWPGIGAVRPAAVGRSCRRGAVLPPRPALERPDRPQRASCPRCSSRRSAVSAGAMRMLPDLYDWSESIYPGASGNAASDLVVLSPRSQHCLCRCRGYPLRLL